MPKTALPDPDATKRAAQLLLKQGDATYAEISRISGRSREIVRFWAKQLGAETARAERLEKLWQEALRQAR